jgi:regulator of cell morphogenesis and NO signaling
MVQLEKETMNVVKGMIERLHDEHLLLRERLYEFTAIARVIGAQEDCINWVGCLQDLRNKAARFMNDLDLHAAWENDELFPAVEHIAEGNRGVLLSLECKHELAKLYVEAFVHAVDQIHSPVRSTEARSIAAYIIKAYEALEEHFKGEEIYLANLKPRELH